MACGLFHNLIVTDEQRLYTWGATPQSLKFRALLQKRKLAASANATTPTSTTPAAGGGGGSSGSGNGLSYQGEGSVTIEGGHLKPMEIDLLHAVQSKSDKIKQLICGFHHSAFLTDSGQLYTWGKNLEFQLGHGDKKV